jgi:hypothetical protein
MGKRLFSHVPHPRTDVFKRMAAIHQSIADAHRKPFSRHVKAELERLAAELKQLERQTVSECPTLLHPRLANGRLRIALSGRLHVSSLEWPF